MLFGIYDGGLLRPLILIFSDRFFGFGRLGFRREISGNLWSF